MLPLARSSFRLALLMLSIATVVVHDVAQAQRIKSGLSFLKLGAGADAIARGDADVTAPSAAQAVFYNPAALGDAARASIMAMHNESIVDVRNDVLGAALPLGAWAVGLGVQATTVSGVEIRDNASVQPIVTFTSVEGAVTVGLAYAASNELSVGASAKALVEKIYTDDAAGIAVDVGARYRPEHSAWAFGAVLQNLGSMGALGTEKITLPAMARLGASYAGAFGAANDFAYIVEAGGDKTFADEGMHVRAGGQLVYDGMFALRAGVKSGYESSALTAGLGFRYRGLAIDYALQPYSQDYGVGHAFSLSIGL